MVRPIHSICIRQIWLSYNYLVFQNLYVNIYQTVRAKYGDTSLKFKTKMNLEEISKTLLSNTTGAQNVTAAVLDLITKLGRERRKRPSSSVSIGNDQLLPHYNSEVAQEADDEAVILAHNLSAILFSYFQNDTDLLEILTNNLRDEEIRWLKEANRRLSDITFSIIISVYVKLFCLLF